MFRWNQPELIIAYQVHEYINAINLDNLAQWCTYEIKKNLDLSGFFTWSHIIRFIRIHLEVCNQSWFNPPTGLKWKTNSSGTDISSFILIQHDNKNGVQLLDFNIDKLLVDYNFTRLIPSELHNFNQCSVHSI